MSGVVVVVVVVSGQPVSSVDPISIPTSFACVCVCLVRRKCISQGCRLRTAQRGSSRVGTGVVETIY